MNLTFNLRLLSTIFIIFFISMGSKAVSQSLIQPVVNCVTYDSITGNYTAYFGYINESGSTINIPAGKENKLTPGKHSGQPTTFYAGKHNFVFQITFNGSDLTWHLDSDPYHLQVKSATANSSMMSCINVSGVVTDLSTGNPLAGVNVKSKKGLQQTTTSSDGRYSLSPVISNDTLIFSKTGYHPREEVVQEGSMQLYTELQEEITGLEPVFFAPNEGNALWPELFYLADQYESGIIIPSNDIYQIDSIENTILIEVWANQNTDMQQLRNLLISYGLRNEIYGGSNLQITGWFPIENLKKLNDHEDLINFVRPVFTPISSVGLVTSQSDSALKADLARQGFNLGGKGVKVGVLSDSYDSRGDMAAMVVSNGDLPGSANSGNLTPVEIFLDNPRGSNEGMGMLEIIHDIAPEAQLGFRTGFLSPGDMANGIIEFADAGYDVIVDDITYLSEPFAPKGQIAKAVDYASANGVHYVTSAGNFGDRSFGGIFNPSASPLSFPYINNSSTYAHDFGGGDIFQQVKLEPGVYVLELQWEDNFYSQNEFPGSVNDLDIWIVDGLGNLLYSGNRQNTGEDPIEILAFKVTAPVVVNIMITGSSVPAGLNYQYIIFRGDKWTFNEHNANSSTIVGHAASPSLSSVGAIFYGYTPAFTADPSLMKSNPYSSRGGNLLGSNVQKPDFIATDGANTSSFGSDIQYDADNFPNFFGTSAAAPHTAGLMALVLEAYDRFYDNSSGAIKNEISSLAMRDLFSAKAIDLDDNGLDNISGAGLLNVKAVLDSLANTSPQDPVLIVPDGVTPGDTTFTLTVEGKYLNDQTQLLYRGESLAITNRVQVDEVTSQLQAVIEPFIGNPPLNLYNPPKPGTNGSDGGYSDSVYFFTPRITTVTINAVDTVKKYGEALPSFKFTITPALSAEELVFLPEVIYNTPATSTSDVGVYFVAPGFATDAEVPVQLQELYTFEFTNGALFVDPLPLTVTPNDMTITYGDKVGEITFDYSFGEGMNIPLRDSILLKIKLGHENQLVQDTFALLNRSLGLVNRSLGLVNRSLGLVNNTAWVISEKALFNRSLGLVNGNYAVDIDFSLLEEYETSPSGTLINRSLGLVNSTILANGDAMITLTNENGEVIGNRSLGLVNRSLGLVNSETSGSSNDSTVVIVSEEDSDIEWFYSINLITGLTATTPEEPHYIVPGAFYNKNFIMDYEVGLLNINKAELTLTALDTFINEQDTLPVFRSVVEGYKLNDTFIDVFGDSTIFNYQVNPEYTGLGGQYNIIPSVQEPYNYIINPVNGILNVNPTISGNKIKIFLECHELVNDGLGNKVRAYFSYYNRDAIAWHIPLGNKNSLVGITNYEGEVPVVFLPGQHIFSVTYDGSKMNWQVYSTSIDKSSYASSENVNSQGCSSVLAGSSTMEVTYDVYPNPTRDYVKVSFSNGSVNDVAISVLNSNGYIQYVPVSKDDINNIVEINLSEVPVGTYYIVIVNELGETSTLRVYKE